MIDKEIVATRLSKLREALRCLRDIAAMSRAEFLASAERKALSEHFLRIALESMLDTGNHVIAEMGLRKPLRLRDVPLILDEHELLDHDLGSTATRRSITRSCTKRCSVTWQTSRASRLRSG